MIDIFNPKHFLENNNMELKVIKADGDYTHVALCGRLDIDGVTSVEMNFTNVVSAKGKPAIVDNDGSQFYRLSGDAYAVERGESPARQRSEACHLQSAACRAGSASDCRFCRSNADRERFFKSIDSFEERLTV